MMTKKRHTGEWLLLATFLFIVVLIFQQIATSLTEQGVASGDALFNAALFPEIVAVTILGLGGLIGFALVLHRKYPGKYLFTAAQTPHVEEPPEDTSHLRRLQFQLVALLIAYLLLLEPVGFHITTTLIVSTMVWCLGARPFYFPLLTGFAITFVISFLFEGLLKVILPLGYFEISPPYALLGL